MSQIVVGWILALAFVMAGTLLIVLARPFAKLSVWWQSLWTGVPALKWLSNFTLDEPTTVVVIRVIGVSFFVIAISAIVLAFALPGAQPPH